MNSKHVAYMHGRMKDDLWKFLNRLRIGVGSCKTNLSKRGYATDVFVE